MRRRMQIAPGIAVTTVLVLAGVGSQAQERAGQQAPITEGRLTDPAPDLPRGAYLPPNWLADDQFLQVAVSARRSCLSRPRRVPHQGPHQRDHRHLAQEPRRRQPVLGTNHRHPLRQDDDRLGGRAVQAHRPRTGAPPGIRCCRRSGSRRRGRSLSPAPARRLPIKTAFPLFNSVATSGHRRARAHLDRHGHCGRLRGSQRPRQGCHPVRLPESRRSRQHGADARRGEARRRSGRGGSRARARASRAT